MTDILSRIHRGANDARDVRAAARKLEGSPVVNPEARRLGSVSDVMIDMDDARMAYAVLSFGGFLGLGDTLYAIPPSALAWNFGEGNLVLDATREALREAPGISPGDWPNTANPRWDTDIRPYWTEQSGGG